MFKLKKSFEGHRNKKKERVNYPLRNAGSLKQNAFVSVESNDVLPPKFVLQSPWDIVDRCTRIKMSVACCPGALFFVSVHLVGHVSLLFSGAF